MPSIMPYPQNIRTYKKFISKLIYEANPLGVKGQCPLRGPRGSAPGGGPASRLAGGVGGNAPEAKRFTLIR